MQESIRLRELELEDVESLFNFYSDREAMKFRRTKPMKSINDAKLFVKNKKVQQGEITVIRKAVELSTEQQVIGSVMFRYDGDKEAECEIGYSIGREYWGQGYGRQVVKLMIESLKTQEGITKLVAWTMKENMASSKILEKNGFNKVEQNEYPESYLFVRANGYDEN